MSEFDEYLNKNFDSGLGDPSIYILRHTFEAGAQSKQAEIDELRKRIDEAILALEKKSTGLKGLVDNYNKSLNILKGTTNEQ